MGAWPALSKHTCTWRLPLGERDAVGDVVGAAGPLEAVRGDASHGPVATAHVELPGGAAAGDGVRDPRGRDGVDEGRLAGTCAENNTCTSSRRRDRDVKLFNNSGTIRCQRPLSKLR